MATATNTTRRSLFAIATAPTSLPTVANDNTKPRSCTWTSIIRAMAKVSPDCERSAWMARKKGCSAQQYVDRMIAAYEGTEALS